jgi:hypothetical protein
VFVTRVDYAVWVISIIPDHQIMTMSATTMFVSTAAIPVAFYCIVRMAGRIYTVGMVTIRPRLGTGVRMCVMSQGVCRSSIVVIHRSVGTSLNRRNSVPHTFLYLPRIRNNIVSMRCMISETGSNVCGTVRVKRNISKGHVMLMAATTRPSHMRTWTAYFDFVLMIPVVVAMVTSVQINVVRMFTVFFGSNLGMIQANRH